MDNPILIYLALINLLAFALYGLDKYRAKRNKWRVSEKNLLLAALVGGSVGAYTAMKLFRHKTQHPKFTVGVPLCIVLHLAIAGYMMIG